MVNRGDEVEAANNTASERQQRRGKRKNKKQV